jgi:hypothetical protein
LPCSAVNEHDGIDPENRATGHPARQRATPYAVALKPFTDIALRRIMSNRRKSYMGKLPSDNPVRAYKFGEKFMCPECWEKFLNSRPPWWFRLLAFMPHRGSKETYVERMERQHAEVAVDGFDCIGPCKKHYGIIEAQRPPRSLLKGHRP